MKQELLHSVKVSTVKQSGLMLRQVSGFIESEIRAIPYYNDLARSHESTLYDKTNIEKLIKDNSSNIIVATINGALAGVLVSKFDCYTRFINWILVKEQFRRNEIALQLLQQCIQLAKEEDCNKVWCDCLTVNVEAVAFFKNQSFTIIAQLKNHWYGQDFYLLEKNIKNYE